MRSFACVTAVVSLAMLAPAMLAPAWLAPARAAAPDIDVERIVTRQIGDILPANSAGGVAVAVRLDGRTLFFNYGQADASGERPVTPDTLFNLGSLGKVFDTALLAQAARQGELSFEDSVADHVGELGDGGDIRRVTLGQLATYTSGLVLPQDHPPWPKEVFSRSEFIAALKRWTADDGHQPGRQVIYSHAGFILLHLALEERFGLPFGDLMRRRLLDPLGLASTTLPVPAADAQAQPRGEIPATLARRAAQGYSIDGEPVGTPGDLQGYYHWLGAGQMYSSTRDMAVFLAANLGDLPGHRALQAAMQVPHRAVAAVDERLAQAMAWEARAGEFAIVDKYGGLNNTSAYIGMVPSEKIGIVILTNRGSQDAGSVGRAVLLALARQGRITIRQAARRTRAPQKWAPVLR
jgi:beta-lactamase class C